MIMIYICILKNLCCCFACCRHLARLFLNHTCKIDDYKVVTTWKLKGFRIREVTNLIEILHV